MLLAAQLVAVLAYPFLDGSVGGRAVIGVVQLGVVLAAVAAVRLTPALTWVAVLLGGPAMVLTVLEAWQPDSDAVVLASAAFHVPFYFYISYAMLKYLFHDDRVTRDELFATGAAFTVVAWGFAYVYAACQVDLAGLLHRLGRQRRPAAGSSCSTCRSRTLTSVGLSDVVPVEGHARSFVMVEMVAGVFYVALVVARLVSLAVVRQRPRA